MFRRQYYSAKIWIFSQNVIAARFDDSKQNQQFIISFNNWFYSLQVFN